VRAEQSRLSSACLDQVAGLHCASLPLAFVSSLGRPFVRTMYRAIDRAPGCCVIVSHGPAGEVAGFVAGSVSRRAMFGWIMPRYAARFVFHALLRPHSPATVRRIAETGFYLLRAPRSGADAKAGTDGRRDAELLSIAVAPQWRQKRVGSDLVAALEAFLLERACTRYRVVTHAPDNTSNRFYLAAGFALARTFHHHGRQMHEYVKAIAAPVG
jgi:ribosomal protein S18 acetylase RimI-like enzyme